MTGIFSYLRELREFDALYVSFSQGDEALLSIVRVGASVGGARPKAVIAYNPHTGDIKSGQIADIS